MVLLGGKTNVEEARELWWAAYNGTGEVLLKTDITPAYTSLLESYKSSLSSTFQQLWSLMYIVYYWSNS